MTIPWFFSLFLYVVTFDDLAKVKQGHSQMGSISSLIYNSMTNNPWKFHAFPQICTIVALFETNPPYYSSCHINPLLSVDNLLGTYFSCELESSLRNDNVRLSVCLSFCPSVCLSVRPSWFPRDILRTVVVRRMLLVGVDRDIAKEVPYCFWYMVIHNVLTLTVLT